MQVLVRTPCQCELETNSESPLHTIPLNLPPSSWITGAHHNSQQSLGSGYVRQAVDQTRTGVSQGDMAVDKGNGQNQPLHRSLTDVNGGKPN